MSLTLDSSLFYTLLLLITEVRHHLCSNAPDTLPLVEISFPQLHPHYFYFRLHRYTTETVEVSGGAV